MSEQLIIVGNSNRFDAIYTKYANATLDAVNKIKIANSNNTQTTTLRYWETKVIASPSTLHAPVAIHLEKEIN